MKGTHEEFTINPNKDTQTRTKQRRAPHQRPDQKRGSLSQESGRAAQSYFIVGQVLISSTRMGVTTPKQNLLVSNNVLLICPKWIRFGSSCYFLSKESKSWDEAREFCRARRADLVVINTKEENVRNCIFGLFWITSTYKLAMTFMHPCDWVWADSKCNLDPIKRLKQLPKTIKM
uniref:C-type lectin domain-containing protein n=1 Tax=Oryzias sinensis TaxID=183150 RepID=A0A8C7YB51_9TELE